MDIEVFVPCDQCGRKSWLFAMLKDGRELSFCGHHGTVNFDRLVLTGATIEDHRHEIPT